MKHKLFFETFPAWCKDKDRFALGKIERVVESMLGQNATNKDVLLISRKEFLGHKNTGDKTWNRLCEYCSYVLEKSQQTGSDIPESLFNQQKNMLELYDAEIMKLGRYLWIETDNGRMINPIYLLRERAVENLIKLNQICKKTKE